MKLARANDIADLRSMARRYLPAMLFDWIEEAAGDERALLDNLDAFQRYCLMPRYLRDVSGRSQSATILGHTWDSPFGFCPTGMQGLIRGGAEVTMAAAAAAANIPYAMSGLSTARLEEVARVAGPSMWYQPYPTANGAIYEDLIRRAAAAGIDTLIVTIDLPVEGKRLRSLRHRPNGRPRFGSYLEALTHVGWTYQYLRHRPKLEDLSVYLGGVPSRRDLDEFFGEQYLPVREKQTWADLETCRRLWPGNLVVKGVLSAQDAAQVADIGADAVIVSNHGGRQLERAPTPLQMLGPVKAAVGQRIPVMMDGGIRRGSDIVVSLCLGADFVFLGRSVLYGLAAAGKSGVEKVIEIMRSDIDTVMGQIGARSTDQLSPQFLAAREPPIQLGLPQAPRSLPHARRSAG